jgi:hypothetical protein
MTRRSATEWGTQQDLADTVTAVAALGRKIIARKADVRDAAAIRQVVDDCCPAPDRQWRRIDHLRQLHRGD